MGETTRFNATLGAANAPLASEAWPYIRDGLPVPGHLRTAVGDYIGAGNWWITRQAEFVPIGYVKQGDTFVPAGSGNGGDIIQYPEPTEIVVVPMAWGSVVRGYMAESRKITAMEFIAAKNGRVTLSVSEHQGVATYRQSCMAATKEGGSFGAGGNTSTASIDVVAGQKYYFKFRAWSGDIGPTANAERLGVSVEGAWPE